MTRNPLMGVEWHLALTLCASVFACGPEHPHGQAVNNRKELISANEGETCLPLGRRNQPFSAEASDAGSVLARPASANGVVLGNETICHGDECTVCACRFDVIFPSQSLLSPSGFSKDIIKCLTSVLAPERQADDIENQEAVGMRPVVSLNVFWNSSTPQRDLEDLETILIDVYIGEQSIGRFELLRGSNTRVVVHYPILDFYFGHTLDDGTQYDGLKSSKHIAVVLSDTNDLNESNILIIKNQLSITVSCVLSRDDLTRIKEKSIQKIKEHAREAQVHLKEAQRHATLAEHVSVADYLSTLDVSIDQKMSQLSPQHIESIISPDEIPVSSAACITPTNMHLEQHILAMVRNLQKANFAAGRSHRFFVGLSATTHLKVEE